MFRPEDNLESLYARDALRQLYLLIVNAKVEGCSLLTFESATGLSLLDIDGCLREELPPITTFLNRMLALTIDLQNILFRSEEHTSELQSLMRISYAVFCLKKKNKRYIHNIEHHQRYPTD